MVESIRLDEIGNFQRENSPLCQKCITDILEDTSAPRLRLMTGWLRRGNDAAHAIDELGDRRPYCNPQHYQNGMPFDSEAVLDQEIPYPEQLALFFQYFSIKRLLMVSQGIGIVTKADKSRTNMLLFAKAEELLKTFPFEKVDIDHLMPYQVHIGQNSKSQQLRLRDARYSVLYEYAYHMMIKQSLLNEMARQGLFVYEDYDSGYHRATGENIEALRLYIPDGNFERFDRFLDFFDRFAASMRLDVDQRLLHHLKDYPAQAVSTKGLVEGQLRTRHLYARHLRYQHVQIPRTLKPDGLEKFRDGVNSWYMHAERMQRPFMASYQVL